MLKVYSTSFRRYTHILVTFLEVHLQKKFIVFQTLGGCSANDWSDGPPLSRHQLGQVQEFFLFFSGPFCFLNAWIQPLIPILKDIISYFNQSPRMNIYILDILTSSIWKMQKKKKTMNKGAWNPEKKKKKNAS